MRITKALISLRGCAGWSGAVLFANPLRQVFLRRGPYVNFLEGLIQILAAINISPQIGDNSDTRGIRQPKHLNPWKLNSALRPEFFIS